MALLIVVLALAGIVLSGVVLLGGGSPGPSETASGPAPETDGDPTTGVTGRGPGESSQEAPEGSGVGGLTNVRNGGEGSEVGTLAGRVEGITEAYPGEYGVVLWQPGSGKRVSLNADKSFPAASLAKLPLFLALYREAASGALDLDEKTRLLPADIQPGTGVLMDYRPGTRLALREYARFLVSESDNTAWSVLERRVGERRVEAELSSVGVTATNYEYGKNVTTPDDVALMLERIASPRYTSPRLSKEMLRHMTGTSFENRIPEGVPADARVAHKIGILGDSFSDAGVVYPNGTRQGRYYIVVLSDGTTRASSREATQRISLAAYRHFVGPDVSQGTRGP